MSYFPFPRRSQRIATGSAPESPTPEAATPADGAHSPLPPSQPEPSSEATRRRRTSSFGATATNLKKKLSTPVLRGAKVLAQAAKENLSSLPKRGRDENAAQGGPPPSELHARLDALSAQVDRANEDSLGVVPGCFLQPPGASSTLSNTSTRGNTPPTVPSSSIATPPMDDGEADAFSDNYKVVRARLPNRPSVRGLFDMFSSEEIKTNQPDVTNNARLRGGGTVPFPRSESPAPDAGPSGTTTPPPAPIVRLVPPTPLGCTDKPGRDVPDKSFLRPPFRRSPRGSPPAPDDDVSETVRHPSTLPVRPPKNPRRFSDNNGPTSPVPLFTSAETAPLEPNNTEASAVSALLPSTNSGEDASNSPDNVSDGSTTTMLPPRLKGEPSQPTTAVSTSPRKRKSDAADVEMAATKTPSKKAKRRGRNEVKQPNHRTAAIPKSALKVRTTSKPKEAATEFEESATEKIILRIPQRSPSTVATLRPMSPDNSPMADQSSELGAANASPDIEPPSPPTLAKTSSGDIDEDDKMEVDVDGLPSSEALAPGENMQALHMFADVAANAARAEVPTVTVTTPVAMQAGTEARTASASDITRHTAAEALLKRMRGVIDAAAQTPGRLSAPPERPNVAQTVEATEATSSVNTPGPVGLQTPFVPVATEPGWVPKFWYSPPRSRTPTSSIRSTAIDGDDE